MSELVLVTGAGGFLGRPLMARLRRDNIACRGLFGPDDDPSLLTPHDLVGDICDPDVLRQAADGATSVIHLAGPPSVARSFNAPAETFRAHAVGTAMLVEALATQRLNRFVYISSAEVYGQPLSNPVSESTALAPRSPYAGAKVAAESAVTAAAITQGHSAVILRPFTLYGPGLRTGSLLDQIMSDGAAGRPISVMDLRPIRDYLWVDDAVEAIRAALDRRPHAPVGVYNLGSGNGSSVHDIISMVQGQTGSTHEIRATGARDRHVDLDIDELIASTARLTDWLDWYPSVALEAGIATLLAEHGFHQTVAE